MTKYYANINHVDKDNFQITITTEDITEFEILGEDDYDVFEIPHKIIAEIMMSSIAHNDQKLGLY